LIARSSKLPSSASSCSTLAGIINMKEEEVFKFILSQISFLKKTIEKRKWDLTQDLILDRPATNEEIADVEKELGIKIPTDYKNLFKLSKHIEFRYQFDEEMPPEFRSNFSGELYWNLDELVAQTKYLNNWITASLDPSYNDEASIENTRLIFNNKLPLLKVPNGDVIVIGNNPSEIVYFSHEGDSMHGKILGENLWNFLEFYSRIGFDGSEDWQLEPFYNYKADRMITEGPIVDKYISWLKNNAC